MSAREHTLSGWLTTATAWLPASASARIGAEIEDHVDESEQRFLRAGISAGEARSAAIRALGDPRQLAVHFRELHFSRGEYARGGAAALALLVLAAAGGMVMMLSRVGPGTRQVYEQWMFIWQIVWGSVSVFLIIPAARAIVKLLREQYDIRAPEPGWYVLAISFLATVPYAVAEAVEAYRIGNPLVWWQLDTPLIRAIAATRPDLYTLASLGFTVGGALAAVFCARWLLTRGSRGLLPGTLLGLGLLIGAGLAADHGTIVLIRMMTNDQIVAMWAVEPMQPVIGLIDFVRQVMPVVHIGTLAIVLALCGHIRRQGAVIAC